MPIQPAHLDPKFVDAIKVVVIIAVTIPDNVCGNILVHGVDQQRIEPQPYGVVVVVHGIKRIARTRGEVPDCCLL